MTVQHGVAGTSTWQASWPNKQNRDAERWVSGEIDGEGGIEATTTALSRDGACVS